MPAPFQPLRFLFFSPMLPRITPRCCPAIHFITLHASPHSIFFSLSLALENKYRREKKNVTQDASPHCTKMLPRITPMLSRNTRYASPHSTEKKNVTHDAFPHNFNASPHSTEIKNVTHDASPQCSLFIRYFASYSIFFNRFFRWSGPFDGIVHTLIGNRHIDEMQQKYHCIIRYLIFFIFRYIDFSIFPMDRFDGLCAFRR